MLREQLRTNSLTLLGMRSKITKVGPLIPKARSIQTPNPNSNREKTLLTTLVSVLDLISRSSKPSYSYLQFLPSFTYPLWACTLNTGITKKSEERKYLSWYLQVAWGSQPPNALLLVLQLIKLCFRAKQDTSHRQQIKVLMLSLKIETNAQEIKPEHAQIASTKLSFQLTFKHLVLVESLAR